MKAAIDRRAHLGGKIGGVDDVLDPDGDAAQRASAWRVRRYAMADERADFLVFRGDRFQRLRNRGIRGEIAVFDAALQIGE